MYHLSKLSQLLSNFGVSLPMLSSLLSLLLLDDDEVCDWELSNNVSDLLDKSDFLLVSLMLGVPGGTAPSVGLAGFGGL